jgi:hypothetical protein
MPARARLSESRVYACSTSAKICWGEGRDSNPHRPGSRPGALPLSYRHQSNQPLTPSTALRRGVPVVRKVAPFAPGCLRFDGYAKTDTRRPHEAAAAPGTPGRTILRSGGLSARRRAAFVHRGPAPPAPHLFSTVRIVRERMRVATGPPRLQRCSGLPGAKQKPPADLSAYRGFLDAGDPLHLCWAR